LALAFLERAAAGARPLTLSREALGWLRNHSWPGNVR
jgi:DNA-binding NtrC family response regulator